MEDRKRMWMGKMQGRTKTSDRTSKWQTDLKLSEMILPNAENIHTPIHTHTRTHTTNTNECHQSRESAKNK